MGKRCCVPQCRNTFSKGCGLHFHTFPECKSDRRKWLSHLRMNNIHQGPISYVCSAHFLLDDYENLSTGSGCRLKKGSVPSQNIPIRSFEKNYQGKITLLQSRYEILCSKRFIEANDSLPDNLMDHVNNDELQCSHNEKSSQTETSHCHENTGTQTGIFQTSVSSQTMLKGIHIKSCCFEVLSNTDITYLTGFNTNRFNLLLLALKDDLVSNEFEINLKLPDQLILCLFKLRHNIDFILIGFMYQICRITASKIFKHVIKILYKYLKAIDFWGEKYTEPNSYTAIIDCTEIKTERSHNPQVNQDLFSHYKNSFTLKYLVAIDEKGLVIFVSHVFGGSASDRSTIMESGFLNLLKPNDIILADRGFDISDILENQKVVLNIPPFLRGKNQLTEDEVIETRIVANRRIHIERVIGLTKKFDILNGTFPAHLWHLADYIIYSVNMLCNFKNRIVP